MDDEAFVRHVGDRLAELPGVEAVTLGGSRAEGTSRPDSDWDFSLYYQGRFEPRALRDVGWPGEVSEIGGLSDVRVCIPCELQRLVSFGVRHHDHPCLSACSASSSPGSAAG